MIIQLTRFIFATLGALAGLAVKDRIDWSSTIGYPETLVIFLFVILGCAIGFIFGGIIGRELTRASIFIEDYIRRMSAGDLVLAVGGLLVGLLIAVLTSAPLRMVEPQWVSIAGTVMAFIVLGYVGVRLAMLKRRDFARLIPRLAEASIVTPGGTPKILDTSVVIDGRFGDLLKSGFLEGRIRVPGFVLAELQALADSADETKRIRGRRGLDQISTLQHGDHVIEALDLDYPDVPDVDGKLVRLARETGFQMVTVDHNLTQVARIQGVDVLNINELATALRPPHLPGEVMHVVVSREGKEPDQGVAYLEDGTMVVVQNGRDSIGADIDVLVTSVLQTSGGRMLFARPQDV